MGNFWVFSLKDCATCSIGTLLKTSNDIITMCRLTSKFLRSFADITLSCSDNWNTRTITNSRWIQWGPRPHVHVYNKIDAICYSITSLLSQYKTRQGWWKTLERLRMCANHHRTSVITDSHILRTVTPETAIVVDRFRSRNLLKSSGVRPKCTI